jgi:hypothetical protein
MSSHIRYLLRQGATTGQIEQAIAIISTMYLALHTESVASLQRRHFTPFLVSTDGLLGEEAKTVMRKISEKLADKWRKPYSEVSGYVNARMSIAIVRAPR